MSVVESERRLAEPHLGVLLGRASGRRIIGLSTGAVLEDPSLTRAFWGLDAGALDNGFQAHLYTRPGDCLVVQVPAGEGDPLAPVLAALRANHDLWYRLAGIRLAAPDSPLALTSREPGPPPADLPRHVSWHVGDLLAGAVERHLATGDGLLAFVLDTPLVERIGPATLVPDLVEQARATTQLMDKNVAMGALQAAGIACAATYPVDQGTDPEQVLGDLPPQGHFVFKPAGGAAGVGVHGHRGGVERDLLRSHIDRLRREGRLPRRFQIQEFLEGPSQGVTAYLDDDGTVEVFEVHDQQVDAAGRFVGGRWSRPAHEAALDGVTALCRSLTRVARPRVRGLVGLDLVGGKAVEVNPRCTAAAPITQLLRQQPAIRHHVGSGFRIERIDLNGRVPVPMRSVHDGTLLRLATTIWRSHRVLVLPQGINPYGDSRCAFVNDDPGGSAQRRFLELLPE